MGLGTRMSRWNLGSMVRINGLFHLLINGRYTYKWDIFGIYLGYNPLTNLLLGYNPRILTFDPNFQWDIQAGVHAPNSHIRVCVLFWGEKKLFRGWDFLERQPWGCILKHTLDLSMCSGGHV